MSAYRVGFERIGRTHNVPPLTCEADTPDELAERVHRHARQYLASRDYDVDVLFNDDQRTGTVSIGWGRFGGGTFEEVTPDGDTAGNHRPR